MAEYHLGAIESRFADMIWENEPISASALAKLAEAELTLKKTTSYTVLKRLCDKGLFQNESGTVTSRVSRDEFYAMQSEKFVDDTFGGSLPAFIAAFASRKRPTEKELEEIRRMIEKFGEE